MSSEGLLAPGRGVVLPVPPTDELVVRIERDQAVRLQVQVDWLRTEAAGGYRFFLYNDEGNVGFGLPVRSHEGARLSFEHWLSVSFARHAPNLRVHVRNGEGERVARFGPIPAVAGLYGPFVVR